MFMPKFPDCFIFLVKHLLKNIETTLKYFEDVLTIDNYITKRESPEFILKLLIKVNMNSKDSKFCKSFLNNEVG